MSEASSNKTGINPVPLELGGVVVECVSPVVVQISLTIAPWLEYITVEHLFYSKTGNAISLRAYFVHALL